MNILVCVKQVPDTADIQWNENNTIKREGTESILNPFDEFAAETALRIKEDKNAKVTVMSMGPNQAKDVLREVLSMGADEAVLLSDKKFSGSDTAATSYTLACAVHNMSNRPDLIICGQCATDGDTAQTGPSLSKRLNYSLITFVKEVEEVTDKYIIAKRETEQGLERIRANFPALICTLKGDFTVRLPLIKNRIAAQQKEITVWGAEDISASPDKIGIKGSPTFVSRAFRPKVRQGGDVIDNISTQEKAQLLADKIKEFLN